MSKTVDHAMHNHASCEGVFNGKRVRYTAEIDSFEVVRGGSEPVGERALADVVCTTYRAAAVDGVPVDPLTRPVVFAFNGGPIVPSVYLHLLAFGPKRVSVPEDLGEDPMRFPLVDNVHSLLDVADLVFFDPPGTGFSRTRAETAANAFFEVDADAQAFVDVVRQWCHHHDRLESPKFIFGESYGSVRAAVSAKKLAGGSNPIRLDGVFLMGQAVNIVETVNRPENVMSYVVTLPTLVALGAYHGRVRSNLPLPLLMEEAATFAETTYLQALLKGQRISEQELAEVAADLEAFTGLPASEFVSRRLRIGKVAYRKLLLQDRGLILGGMDGRYVAPAELTPEQGDASAILSHALAAAHRTMMAQTFDNVPDATYVVDSPVAGFDDWRWGASTPFSDWRYGQALADTMRANPEFRLMIGVGYHDTFTTYGASLYAIKQSEWPLDRVSFRAYFGGHMAYTVESSLKSIAHDVREWIGGRPVDAERSEQCDAFGRAV